MRFPRESVVNVFSCSYQNTLSSFDIEYCQNLSFQVLSELNFKVLSRFEFLSFVTVLFMSFITIVVCELSFFLLKKLFVKKRFSAKKIFFILVIFLEV